MQCNLETERLVLSIPTKADFEEFARMWSLENVVKYISGKPSSRSESLDRLQRVLGGWVLDEHGFFSIHEKSTGAYIGQTGLFNAIRDLGDDFDDAVEAGWTLLPEFTGKGYAFEATKAAHEWFDDRYGRRTVCMVVPEHAASINLAKKMGYSEMRLAEYAETEVLLMERKN